MIVTICLGLTALFSRNSNETAQRTINTHICANKLPLKSASECISFEYATTDQQRTRGLSDRDSLESNRAMLFVFDNATEQCIWMKDMKFSIDIIWLNDKKEIVKIEPNVSPQTYPENFCAQNTKYVIELKPEAVELASLKLGDRLIF